MKWSRYFLPTLREDPKDAEAISHQLMVRAGVIRRVGSGIYAYLPFGWRALKKAIEIVREEMDRAGAQELLMPALQPVELWKATGRDALLGEVLIRFKDRTGKEVALGPTHEEVVTELLKEVRSHKQLPVTVYQIQAKFRDEPRPRFGVIRSKEFLMKDAYSFDQNREGLNRSYQAMYDAYERIFARCGLSVIACEADTGVMGGEISHEFMAPSPNGEDRVVRCGQCGYAANFQAAKCRQPAAGSQQSAEKPQPLEEVKTPGEHTVEGVSRLLKVAPSCLIKTLLYDIDAGHVAVMVRGDHAVNDAKLARVVASASLKLSSPATIERLTGGPLGFTGPVGLSGITLVADHAVLEVVNGVTGANKADTHLRNVNSGRDFQPAIVDDLRLVTQDDTCPTCGKPLAFVPTIEVGHVFKLGTKYSEALGADFQTPDGDSKPMVMGCYGIGINRILAAALEQRHDEQGIIWPVSLAPFQVLVSTMEASREDQRQLGEELERSLSQAGLDVLLDDREQSPGSKLKDADLVGIPVRVVIGKVWQEAGRLDVRLRGSTERIQVRREDVVTTVQELLDKALPR